MKIKIGVLGSYATGIQDFGGQPVKTRILIGELRNYLGVDQVRSVDTFKWKHRIFHLLVDCLNLVRTCETIIIMPAAKGIIIFAPLFLFLNMFFHRKIHYVVIGGWLPNLLEKRKMLRCFTKRFSGIHVETHVMEDKLKHMGFSNIYYMPNFKRLTLNNPNNISKVSNQVFKFCTFSRVVEGKGIEDAINAIVRINRDSVKSRLDIYGHVYGDYEEQFNSIMANAPEYISYKGLVLPTESVQILGKYYMQIFPTKFFTEGVPGSIIDSYFAGVPVLASKWESFSDVVEEGKTGVGFEFGNYEDLVAKLKWAVDNPDEINKMRLACVRKAVEYTPKRVIGEFLKHLQ